MDGCYLEFVKWGLAQLWRSNFLVLLLFQRMGGPSAKVGRKKQYFSYKKGAREFWGRGGQLILINLVPSGDFSSLFRLKFARVEKE